MDDGCSGKRCTEEGNTISTGDEFGQQNLVPETRESSDVLNEISEQYAQCGLNDSLLEMEALAAIREVAFAVRMLSLPDSLPRKENLIYLNLTTLEDQKHCIELTKLGWRITSNQHDKVDHSDNNGNIDLYNRHFETIYQLLNFISPEFRNQFANKLSKKLSALNNGISGHKEH